MRDKSRISTKKRRPSTGKNINTNPEVAADDGPWLTIDDLDRTKDAYGLTYGQRNGMSCHEFAVDYYFYRYTKPSLDPTYPPNVEELRKRPSRLEGPGFDYGFEPDFTNRCEAHEENRRWNLRHRIVDGKISDSGWVNPDLPTPERRRQDQEAMDRYQAEEIARYTKAHPNWKEEEAQEEAEERMSKKSGPQSTSGPTTPGARAKAMVCPFHILVAECYFDKLKKLGYDLRIFRDDKNNESLWRYEDGLWHLVQNVDAWLEGEVEIVIREMKEPYKSNARTRSEARKFILCSPNVRKLQLATFDQHDMIPVRGNLINPKTLDVRPALKDDYCTWTLDVTYGQYDAEAG